MPYFTTDELRALPDMTDTSRFPDARLVAAHDWIVAIIERECDTSFIEATKTERVSGASVDGLYLRTPYIRSIDEVTVDGAVFGPSDITALVIEDGAIYRPGGTVWPTTSGTRGNIEITYTAGYSDEPPADLKEAALRAARQWLLTMDGWTGIDERATGMTNDYGNLTLSQPGPDRPTGLPSVDATIMAWARRVRVPGVA